MRVETALPYYLPNSKFSRKFHLNSCTLTTSSSAKLTFFFLRDTDVIYFWQMSFSSLGLIFARPVSVILDQGVVRPFSILPKRTDFHLFQFQFYALRSKSKVEQCSSFNVYFIFFWSPAGISCFSVIHVLSLLAIANRPNFHMTDEQKPKTRMNLILVLVLY